MKTFKNLSELNTFLSNIKIDQEKYNEVKETRTKFDSLNPLKGNYIYGNKILVEYNKATIVLYNNSGRIEDEICSLNKCISDENINLVKELMKKSHRPTLSTSKTNMFRYEKPIMDVYDYINKYIDISNIPEDEYWVLINYSQGWSAYYTDLLALLYKNNILLYCGSNLNKPVYILKNGQVNYKDQYGLFEHVNGKYGKIRDIKLDTQSSLAILKGKALDTDMVFNALGDYRTGDKGHKGITSRIIKSYSEENKLKAREEFDNTYLSPQRDILFNKAFKEYQELEKELCNKYKVDTSKSYIIGNKDTSYSSTGDVFYNNSKYIIKSHSGYDNKWEELNNKNYLDNLPKKEDIDTYIAANVIKECKIYGEIFEKLFKILNENTLPIQIKYKRYWREYSYNYIWQKDNKIYFDDKCIKEGIFWNFENLPGDVTYYKEGEYSINPLNKQFNSFEEIKEYIKQIQEELERKAKEEAEERERLRKEQEEKERKEKEEQERKEKEEGLKKLEEIRNIDKSINWIYSKVPKGNEVYNGICKYKYNELEEKSSLPYNFNEEIEKRKSILEEIKSQNNLFSILSDSTILMSAKNSLDKRLQICNDLYSIVEKGYFDDASSDKLKTYCIQGTKYRTLYPNIEKGIYDGYNLWKEHREEQPKKQLTIIKQNASNNTTKQKDYSKIDRNLIIPDLQANLNTLNNWIEEKDKEMLYKDISNKYINNEDLSYKQWYRMNQVIDCLSKFLNKEYK